MSVADLREKSVAELREELTENHIEQFKLRMQQASGELSRPSEMKRVRRNIARIKTLIGQKTEAGES